MLGFGPHNDSPICDFYDPATTWHILLFSDSALVEYQTSPLLSQSIEFSQSVLGEALRTTFEQSLTFSQVAIVNTPVYREIQQSLAFSQAVFPIHTKLWHQVNQSLIFTETPKNNIKDNYINQTLSFLQSFSHNQKLQSVNHRLNFAQVLGLRYPRYIEILHQIAFGEKLIYSPREVEILQALAFEQELRKLSVSNIGACNCLHFDQMLYRIRELDADNSFTFAQYLQNSQNDHKLIFIQTVGVNAIGGGCCKEDAYIPEKTTDGQVLKFAQSVGLEKMLNLSVAQSLTFQNTVVYYD